MPRPRKYQNNADRQREYRQRKARGLRNTSALRNDKHLLKVARPPVRYYGGKWRIAGWIIEQFPPHTCYVEPFAGGASVMLQKRPSKFEVLNDLNNDVINFFDVLRSRPSDLIRVILLTPYARTELRRAQVPADDPLEQARRFYIRCWQSFGSGTGTAKSATGWRYQIGTGDLSRASAIGSWNDTDHLWVVAERLKQIQIECDEALKVIDRFDSSDTLFYLDPPYVHSTRYPNSKFKGYIGEMTDDDHRELADRVRNIEGMAIISGYSSELYNELYLSWKCISRETRDINGKRQLECLWLSPRASKIENLPLFAEVTP